MLIVAQMAGYDPEAKPIFDGLWRFARAHPSSGDAISCLAGADKKGDKPDSAFDGDADIAYDYCWPMRNGQRPGNQLPG